MDEQTLAIIGLGIVVLIVIGLVVGFKKKPTRNTGRGIINPKRGPYQPQLEEAKKNKNN